MFSGFQTGKNKKLQLVENERFHKVVVLLEDMNEDDQIAKSEIKATKTDMNISDSMSKESLASNQLLYHPSKFAEKNFQFLRKPSLELSDKKISYQTVMIGDEPKDNLQTEMKKRKKENQFDFPLIQMNETLLSKISKLSKCLVGLSMFNQSKEFMKNHQLIETNFARTSVMPQNYNWKLIKLYFSKMKVEKDWLKQQVKLSAWKLHSKNQLNDQKLILELEYRYYIQYTLQCRTVIQEIWSKDQGLNCHLVLLVVAIEQYKEKKILELSDGWYSIFFVCEQNFQQIYSKITVGQKIHLTNLKEYPIIFDSTNIKIISAYPFNKLIATTKINSIKKASYKVKLGRQPIQYFLQSLKSLRNGIIPCIDVFIITKSYLIKYDDKNIKRAVIINSEEIQPQEEQKQQVENYSFFIVRVIDSLNYFDGRQKDIKEYKEITIHINDSKIYDDINVGQRVRMINAVQNNSEISVKQTKNSGLQLDLQQYSEYFSTINVKQEIYSITLVIEQHFKTQFHEILIGHSEEYGQIRIEVNQQFFENILKGLEFKKIKVTQLLKIEPVRFLTTQLSKLINIINYK